MKVSRRSLISAVPLLGLAGVHARLAAAPTGRAEIYRVDDEARILEAARAIIVEDPVAALITLDATGVPRVRSVGVSPPEDDLTLWIGTRRGSRKIGQIEANANATLYFNDDAKNHYASFMGEASVHTDEATLQTGNFYGQEQLRQFWPNYPDDFALIRFRPRWLEVAGHGIKGNEAHWQPQAVML